jgi:acyl-CoA thioester hydrolase
MLYKKVLNLKIYKYSMLIKEQHLDTFRHVNNATYLTLLEEARWEFLTKNGLDLNNIHNTGIGPVVLECRIQFLKELRLREAIVIESKIVSFEKKVGMMHQDILNQEGDLSSHAELTFGVFDMKARKLILPPPEWLDLFGIV